MITTPGTSGTITATYTDNGASATPFTPVVFSSPDSEVTFTAIDAFNVTATVAAGDTASSVTINASCGNSDGTTATATPLVIALLPVPQQFVLSIAQTA